MKAVTLKDVRVKGASVAKGTVIDETKEIIAALVRVKAASCDAEKIKAAAAASKKTASDDKKPGDK